MAENRHHFTRIAGSLMTFILASVAGGETLYVDARAGSDLTQGTKAEPLKTIARAAEWINERRGTDPATIVIAPGLYGLDHCITLGGNRNFSQANRLTLRASILPDDPAWRPELMPAILSVENPRSRGRADMPRETYSLKVKTSHVTIQGLRFLGNPAYRNWHCCIERIGDNLDDLLLTQCTFVGSRGSANIYCAALATGDRFIVDRCIFSECDACVVFWDGLDHIAGQGCAMRNCIVTDARQGAVWTCQTAEDFQFERNIVLDSQYIWLRTQGDRQIYTIKDCLFANNRHLSGYAVPSGPTGETSDEVTFKQTHVETEDQLILDDDPRSRRYMHPTKGSTAEPLLAGLFTQ